MQAIPGGKATHDTIDSHKSAVLLRGGMLPQASDYPAERRATRDLLRRRLPLAHQRGALLAPVHHTNRQSNLPAMGNNRASTAHRAGVAERCAAPAGHKSIAVDLARIGYDEARLREGALTLVKTAKQHEATTLSLLHTVPGLGTMLSLVWLYAIHPIDRLPRGQAFASSCRLVTCAKASNGNRAGTSGRTMGQAHLPGAFAEAAVFCLRDHPAGPKSLATVENKPGTGKALALFAHKLARAVSAMLQRQGALDKKRFLHDEGRGVGELDASRDNHGMPRRLDTLSHAAMMASLNACERYRSRSLSRTFDETPPPAPAHTAKVVTG